MPYSDITDSDLMTLAEQRKLVHRRWWRKSETIAVLLVLFGCGYGAGYIHASAVAQQNYVVLGQIHQEEIGRMQALQAGRIKDATVQVQEAAHAAASAAAKVDATAEKVDRAAAQKGPKP